MLAAVLVVLAAATPEAAPTAAAQPPVPAAAPAAPAPAPAPAPAAQSKKDMICKSEQTTGSRFPTKVCYSKAEYEAKQRLDQQQLRQSQTGGLQRQ
jgi:hypothetical protein